MTQHITRKFTVDELDALGVPFDLTADVEVSREIVDQRRWATVWEVLFRHDGRVWSLTYETGSTEYQDVDTFHSDPVEATAMEQRPVTEVRWVPALQGGAGRPSTQPSAERLRTAWTSARRRALDSRLAGKATSALLRCARREVDHARRDASAARAEAEELRRALRSALSSPDTPGVHTTLAHMRKLAGLDDGPARPDLVEPGDEVPALCELADRVAALEELTASQADLLEKHGRALEPSARKTPAAARYRDRGGEVWEHVGTADTYELVQWADGTPADPGAMSPRTLDAIRRGYGPLVRVDAPAGGAE